MNKFNRYNRIFLDQDGDAGGASVIETISAPGVDVPVIEPAGGDTHIEEVTIPESGVKGPADLWGEDPEQQMAEAQAKMSGEERERGPDGKFLPKKKEGEQPDPAVKSVKTKAAKSAAEAPKPPAVKPPAPAKLKLGEEEKTADEWLAEMKALREQANKPAETTPEPTADDKAKAAETEKQTAEKRTAFLAKAAEGYTMKPERLDLILGGGPEAAKALAEELARVQLDTREWMAEQHRGVMDDLRAELQPLLDQHRSVQQFGEEHQALNSNPQLKAHPEGLKLYRQFKEEYAKSYDDIQARTLSGQEVSPQEKAWAIMYGSQTPEGIRDSVVQRAIAEAAKIPLKTNGNGAPAKIETKPPLRITKPQNFDRPGGAAPAVKTESKDGQLVRELTESGRWG